MSENVKDSPGGVKPDSLRYLSNFKVGKKASKKFGNCVYQLILMLLNILITRVTRERYRLNTLINMLFKNLQTLDIHHGHHPHDGGKCTARKFRITRRKRSPLDGQWNNCLCGSWIPDEVFPPFALQKTSPSPLLFQLGLHTRPLLDMCGAGGCCGPRPRRLLVRCWKVPTVGKTTLKAF